MTQDNSPSALDTFLGIKPASAGAKWSRPLLIGAGALAALVLGFFLLGPKPDGKSYATEAVVQGDLQVKVSATGNLAPTDQVSVGSELSGIVETVLVDVNDKVVKGQVLAQIDTLRLRDAVTRSRAALAQAQSGVGQARATVQQSRAALNRLDEVYRLSAGKVPSGTEMDIGKADAARAVANLAAAQAQVASAQAQLSSDNTNLSKATIRSPVTGVVLLRQIEPGQTVAASFNTPTLFTIAEDLTSLKLEVKVDEADVGQVHQGAPVSFAVDAYPGRRFPAAIKRVNVGANASTTTSGTSSSTVVSYNAVLAVQNPDLILRPGMTATADIVANQERNVLLVPNAALRFKPSLRPAKPAGGFPIGIGPPGMRQGKAKEAQIGRGTRQTVFTLGEDGKPQPVRVLAGVSNGSVTQISGPEVKAGLRVITGELATAK